MKPVTFKPESVVITDDVEVMHIAMRLGVIDDLQKRCSLAANGAFLAYKHHATHWILFCHYSGREKVEDNGYMLAAWPKDRFTAAHLEKELERLVKLDGGNALYDEYEASPKRPEQN